MNKDILTIVIISMLIAFLVGCVTTAAIIRSIKVELPEGFTAEMPDEFYTTITDQEGNVEKHSPGRMFGSLLLFNQTIFNKIEDLEDLCK